MDNKLMRDVDPKKKEIWLRFLIETRDKPKNREVLSHYFFEQFKENKVEFFMFLNGLKIEIPNYPETTQKNIANKYLTVLSILCDRFGIHALKRDLDDICFKITNPEKYKEISKKVEVYKESEKAIIRKITGKLSDLLSKNFTNYELIGRYKTIFSIYQKVSKKHKEVLSLKDIFGFRVVLNTEDIEQCFEVLNVLHDNFMPITELFKDYISIPKINGYQSLHTGLTNVIDDLDIPIEVQIRTKAMHNFAQNGLAAHWMYSGEKKSKLNNEKEQKLFDHLSNSQDGKEKRIYFLSQDNDIFEIDEGSTILDFAYRIHSGIGDKTKSATINDEIVAINYKIQTGEKIIINISDTKQVKPEWLKIIKTKHARKQIETSIRH